MSIPSLTHIGLESTPSLTETNPSAHSSIMMISTPIDITSSNITVTDDLATTHHACHSQSFSKKCLLVVTGILLILAQILVVVVAPLQPIIATILCLAIISVSLGLFILECCWGVFKHKEALNHQLITFENKFSLMKDDLRDVCQQLQDKQSIIQEQQTLINSQAQAIAALQKDIEVLCKEKETILANQEKTMATTPPSPKLASTSTKPTGFRKIMKSFSKDKDPI